MLTNRDDEKEATGAYVDAFVSKDNVRVSDDKPTDTVNVVLARKPFVLLFHGCGTYAKVGTKSLT